jgi:nitrile hydratase subunit alpha
MSGDHGGASAALAARVRHVEALLERRGLVDARELDRALTAFLAKGSPASGARAVARAWLDEGFRERLLSHANAALPEIGLSMGGGLQEQRLKVVENTSSQHNVIVCTLCSCYPISLLGPSPSWYKSEGYRSRVVREPRAVLHEFGYDVPDDVEITVWDASAESRFMVLPRRPDGTQGLSEAELARLVTRNGLIGVARI